MTPAALISPLVVLAALAVFGLIHSVLASLAAKGWLRAHLGMRTADGLHRLVYNLIAGLTVLPPLALAALLPDQPLYTLPRPALYVTIPLQIAAVVGIVVSLVRVDLIRFLGLRQVFRLLGGEAAPRDPPQLVTTGVHGWTRHPLYTFSLLFIWLTPTMTLNLLALNLGITVYFWIGSVYEERKLLAEFGERYREHQQRTPRLVPLPRKRGRSDDTRDRPFPRRQ